MMSAMNVHGVVELDEVKDICCVMFISLICIVREEEILEIPRLLAECLMRYDSSLGSIGDPNRYLFVCSKCDY